MPSPDYVMQTQETLNDEDLYGILSGECDHLLNEEIDEDEDNHPQAEDEDDAVEPGNDWSIGNPHRQNFLDFQEQTGLKVDMTNKEQVDFFFLIMDNLMNLILNCSNRYAIKIVSGNLKNFSRMKSWRRLTMDDLKTFVGLIIHMGNIKMNRLNDFWKSHYLFQTSIFSQHMSRDRFLNILRVLNVQDEEGNESLKKIKTLINAFNDKMKEIYYPTRDLAIDESLMLWRGRLSFRQYMKSKASRYGIKFYVLADTFGVCQKLHIYAGSRDLLVGGRGHAEKVVHLLLQDYVNCGHSLYINNYYASISLVTQLLDKRTFCTGTLRKNRAGNPKNIDMKLQKGECIILHNEQNLTLCKWHSNREVIVVSSEHNADMVPVQNPRRPELRTLKPNAIFKYTKYMRNVDKIDQLLSYYNSEHKTLKWYKKVIIHIIQICVINSYQMFKMCTETSLSFYDFRIKLLESLLPAKAGIMIAPPTQQKIHLPVVLPRGPSQRTKRKKCRHCLRNKKRVDTIYFCPDCPRSPGLCLTCFRLFHKY